MVKVTISCTDTGRDVEAEVLSRSDKQMRVVPAGTTVPLQLHRTDTRKPYVGTFAGMEFVTQG